jgi:hypothetical protein
MLEKPERAIENEKIDMCVYIWFFHLDTYKV